MMFDTGASEEYVLQAHPPGEHVPKAVVLLGFVCGPHFPLFLLDTWMLEFPDASSTSLIFSLSIGLCAEDASSTDSS